MNDLAAPSKLLPALIGGILLGVLSAVPFLNYLNCFCCLWVIAGGVVAAYLYQNQSIAPIQYGDGAVLGLLTGLVGAVVDALVSIPLRLLGFGLAADALEEALRNLENNPDIPQETIEFLRSLFSQEGIAAVGIFGLLFEIVIFAIFACIGAIIGVAIFSRGKGDTTPTVEPPAAPPPAAPPTPPAE